VVWIARRRTDRLVAEYRQADAEPSARAVGDERFDRAEYGIHARLARGFVDDGGHRSGLVEDDLNVERHAFALEHLADATVAHLQRAASVRTSGDPDVRATVTPGPARTARGGSEIEATGNGSSSSSVAGTRFTVLILSTGAPRASARAHESSETEQAN